MLQMDQQVRLPTLSEADYVHDIAYDYYGTRLALCTSSLRISIFTAPTSSGSQDNSSAAWTETARMERAHAGPIWRLSWGHPEHGEPLVSCSEDHVITVWYQGRGGGAAATQRLGEGCSGLPSWQRRAQLQCDGPVVDVRFAPAPVGIKLAACTADGRAKVFECVNALDLRSWEPEDLELPGQRPAAAAAGAGCSSAALDWMPAPFGSGGDEHGEALAVAGRAGRLAIWVKEKAGRWKELAGTEAHPVAGGGVKDVAWCPNLCRPYEIVATCGAGAALWRVDFSTQDEGYGGTYGRKETSCACQLQLLKQLMPSADEACLVWRCSWNLTGTTLALCPEGGEVSVWKATASLEWRPECEIDLMGGD
mmetsp:Transcript_61861/g.135933  ORF Transcript_61861/g.135933 Transcript_61861/m.135933 type:complete len:365 (-) Transcript_61861:92-1186(-)